MGELCCTDHAKQQSLLYIFTKTLKATSHWYYRCMPKHLGQFIGFTSPSLQSCSWFYQ